MDPSFRAAATDTLLYLCRFCPSDLGTLPLDAYSAYDLASCTVDEVGVLPDTGQLPVNIVRVDDA